MTKTTQGIVSRFFHLLSAQLVETLLSVPFFLLLAWRSSTQYGQIMYAIAIASIVKRLVNFGIYEPLVAELGAANCNKKKAKIIGSVNVFKLTILTITLLGLFLFTQQRAMNNDQTLIILLISLGFGLEIVCESVLADLRVRSEQNEEGRVKRLAYFVSYSFGLVAVLAGFRPAIVASYKLICAFIILSETNKIFFQRYACLPYDYSSMSQIWSMLRIAGTVAVVHLLGIIYNKIHIFYLEAHAGVKGVAYYMATWNLLDPVTVLFTQQLLGWVLFPVLATLWSQKRDQAKDMVRNNVLWMAALATPVMVFFYMESKLIIGTLYPAEYGPAIWMQQLLVVAIPLSFISNLFIYLMVTAGHVPALLFITSLATVLCFASSHYIIPQYLLAGGCYVIITTRFFVAFSTFFFCQVKYRIITASDGLKALTIPALLFAAATTLSPILTTHGATFLVLGVYLLLLYTKGTQLLGCLGGAKAGKTAS